MKRRASMTQARAFVTVAALFLAFASVVVVLWLGAQDVIAHRMTGGALSQFVLFAVLGAGALGQLSEVWNEVSPGRRRGGADRRTSGGRAQIAAPADPLAAAGPPRGELAFDRVGFAYPRGRTRTRARGTSSFRVAPGEVVAIVGPSGAGKSTHLPAGDALLRSDPRRGHARRGRHLQTRSGGAAPRARVRARRTPFIFGASVADNIAYGSPDASRGAIRRRRQPAAADGFIAALPQGYDTQLGERGVTLSGGERQRIAIARAILKDAPVLLLDEATSALDAENETLVQGALEALMQGRTTLVIAHRLATIVEADRILVIEAGRIVEEGTHASLLAAGGLYARLARLQFETGAAALTAMAAQ